MTDRFLALLLSGLLGALLFNGCRDGYSPASNSFSFIDRLDEATFRGNAAHVELEERNLTSHLDGRRLLSPHIGFHPLATTVRVKSALSHSAYSQTEAIYSPAGSEISFATDIPPRSQLEFSPGIIASEPASPGLSYRFEVSLVGASRDKGEAPLYSRVFSQKDLLSGTIGTEKVDLSQFAGTSGDLVFATESTDEGQSSAAPLVWLTPRLVAGEAPERAMTVVLIVMDTVSAARTTL